LGDHHGKNGGKKEFSRSKNWILLCRDLLSARRAIPEEKKSKDKRETNGRGGANCEKAHLSTTLKKGGTIKNLSGPTGGGVTDRGSGKKKIKTGKKAPRDGVKEKKSRKW